MEDLGTNSPQKPGWIRKVLVRSMAEGGVGALCASVLLDQLASEKQDAVTYIANIPDYDADLSGTIRNGFHELGVLPNEIKGKRILIKPNLVETHPGMIHINTHPLVVRAAAEAFRALGAAEILVAEGPGHCRDSLLALEESGLAEGLAEDGIPFVDLNYEQSYSVANIAGFSRLKTIELPGLLQTVDWIVSLPKMKTHHWTGMTLSMKNLFGLIPGSIYGWPKNVLHRAGIHQAILDIYAAVRPHFAIVDGIVGMEGDGPIMGRPCPAGVLVMGRNFPAVDATCARIMGIEPHKIAYLAGAEGWLGTISDSHIQQRGESISSVRREFELVNEIPALQGIRLEV